MGKEEIENKKRRVREREGERERERERERESVCVKRRDGTVFVDPILYIIYSYTRRRL